MKKIIPISLLIVGILLISATFKDSQQPHFSNVPPTGFTGALGKYCTSCHITNKLNEFGGSVKVIGLPEGNYNPSTTYNFSIIINHSFADRRRWGFSITAVNSQGVSVGSFKTTNQNTQIANNELSHKMVPYLDPTQSFTYDNLSWESPATNNANDQNITFFVAANAGNGDGDKTGDYIYATSLKSTITTVPVTLVQLDVIKNNKEALINWSTNKENTTNFFAVEKSFDSLNFKEIGRQPAAGFSSDMRSYTFTDNAQNAGNVFYRIATLNMDGSKSFSGTRQIMFDANADANNIYPNPAKVGTQIKFNLTSAKNQNIVYNIYSTTGKLLISKSIAVNQGQNVIPIVIPAYYQQGYLVARFYVDGSIITKKFLVIK